MTDTTADQAVILWYLHGCTTSHFNLSKEDDEHQVRRRQQTCTQTFSNNLVSLSSSRIADLIIPPPAISQLSSLHTIHLQNNNLTSLPMEIWSLAGLQELNVGYNKIQHLPPEIHRAKALQELFLHNNLLTALPSQIGSLHHLRVLDVTANQLSAIPAEIAKLHLSHFWVEHNLFAVSPPQREAIDGQQHNSIVSCNNQVLSLVSICAQTIGKSTQDSGFSILQHLPSTIQYDLEKCTRQGLICAICKVLIFHRGLLSLGQSRIAGMLVPVSYHCCSQACLSKLLTRTPSENITDSGAYDHLATSNQIHSHRASLQIRIASDHDTLSLERARTL
ncbi:hypothetical protein K450DRAFT_258684 [Umbelopsis ramanniana AG]|uniref:Uncharacterized protein n=1 Tax=Umbelopsis ramanniana AG TaxID=1314678 RepID=A0AAD5HAS6_UMBRA|nr:uncharacterized protein K450DRAFT_258684 [Umbelopsis ramanniana AG]KAI8576059.1 hypothetical protein K450DRAFT_258684 [Umbelopsis ramanniana AG]